MSHSSRRSQGALFTSIAWSVVHSQALAKIEDRQLTSDEGLDLVWCSLVERYVGAGCSYKNASDEYFRLRYSKDPEEKKLACKNPDHPSCVQIPGCGSACAVVYATPVYHHDHRSIAQVRAYHERHPRLRFSLFPSL